jgi:PAS domain S-box-containing protein
MEPAVLLKEAAAVIGATGVIFAAVIGFLRFIRKPLVKFKREIDEALAAIKKIEPMAEAIVDIQQRMLAAEAEARALADSDPTAARFTCDSIGENTHVNATYCRWLGVGRDELIGWRWLSFVPEFDRERLRDEWDSARRERRAYRVRHALETGDRRVIYVDTVVTPVPEEGPIHRWIGVMRRVEPTQNEP